MFSPKTVHFLLSPYTDGDVRLVGGTDHCRGKLELKYEEEWRPMDPFITWNFKLSSIVCRQLSCGNVISTEMPTGPAGKRGWQISYRCRGSESALRDCEKFYVLNSDSAKGVELVCSGNVNNGSNLIP